MPHSDTDEQNDDVRLETFEGGAAPGNDAAQLLRDHPDSPAAASNEAAERDAAPDDEP